MSRINDRLNARLLRQLRSAWLADLNDCYWGAKLSSDDTMSEKLLGATPNEARVTLVVTRSCLGERLL